MFPSLSVLFQQESECEEDKYGFPLADRIEHSIYLRLSKVDRTNRAVDMYSSTYLISTDRRERLGQQNAETPAQNHILAPEVYAACISARYSACAQCYTNL